MNAPFVGPSSRASAVYVVLILLGGLVVAGVGGVGAVGGTHTGSTPSGTDGAGVLALAEQTLAQGAGPAHGTPATCSSAGGLSASCATALASPVPTGAGWTNLTGRVLPTPGIRALAGMTYDAADGYILFFGGQAGSLGVYGHDTWTFSNGGWTNITTRVSGGPPPNSAATSFAYDPWAHEVVLFGGYNGSGNATSYTWTYAGETWTNISGTVGTPPSPRVAAPFVADTSSNQMLLVDGFTNTLQPLVSTWTFSGTSWTNVTNTVSGATPHVIYLNAADDPAAHGVLVFGINSVVRPFVSNTFLFSSNSWSNLTSTLTLAPPPDVIPAMAYVSAMQGVLCSSSISVHPSSGTTYHLIDTWVFVQGAWTNVSGAIGGPDGASLGSATTDASGTIWQFGGTPDGSTLLGYFYAFSWPISVTNFAAAPATVDLGTLTNFSAAVSGAIGPVAPSISFGDGAFANGTLSPTHTYTHVGTFTAQLTATDLAGRTAFGNATVTVNPALTVGRITASPGTPTSGQAVTFNATVSGGTTPYTYAWTLGDGGTSTSTAPSHTYGDAGAYTVNLTVTDAAGKHTAVTVTIKVAAPASTALSLTSGTGLYLLIGLVAALVVIGAVVLALRGRRKPATSPVAGAAGGAGPTPWTPPEAGSSPPPGSGPPP